MELIYWAMMPDGVIFPKELLNGRAPGFLDALYMSGLVLITLGGGDMTPASRPARLFIPLEGVLGLAIFTASISWILSVYPILNRRRVIGSELYQLRIIEEDEGHNFVVGDEGYVSQTVHGIALQLAQVRGDVVQFPITYYFQAVNPQRDIPTLLPYALRLAKRCQQSSQRAVWSAGRVLEGAIRDYLGTVAPMIGGDEKAKDTDLLRALEKDHS